MKTEEIVLSLGSNEGDRLNNLLDAVIGLLGQGIKVEDVSGIYLTAPVGKVDQPDFLNMVIKGLTALEPLAALEGCQEVEKKLGRVRLERWGPRTIDIDILFYGNKRVDEEILKVPHPRMAERAFVLMPLREMDPQRFAELSLEIPMQKVDLKYASSDVKMFLRNKGMKI